MDIEKLKSMIGQEIKNIDYVDNNFILSTDSNKISIKTDNINILSPYKNYIKIQPRTPTHSLSEDFLSEDNYLCYFDVRKIFEKEKENEKHFTVLLNQEQLDLFIRQDIVSLNVDNQIHYCKYNFHRKIVQSDINFVNASYSSNIVNTLISELNGGMNNECDNIFNY